MKKLLIILLTVCILSCLYSCENSDYTKSEYSNQTSSMLSDENASTTDTDSANHNGTDDTKPRYAIVRFCTYDGKIVDTQEIEEGKNITFVPIISHPSNNFFAGWDSALENIYESKNIYPIYDDFSDAKNAIGFDSIYTEKNTEFCINISIGGKVCFSSLELEILLDPSVEVLEIPYTDASAAAHYSKENHSVYISMAFSKNITESMDICQLKLMATDIPAPENAIKISVSDIASLDTENEIVDADYSVYNEKITIMKRSEDYE